MDYTVDVSTDKTVLGGQRWWDAGSVFSLFPLPGRVISDFSPRCFDFLKQVGLMTYLVRSEQLLKSDCCCRPPHAQTPAAYRNEHIIASTVSVSSPCIFMFKPGPSWAPSSAEELGDNRWFVVESSIILSWCSGISWLLKAGESRAAPVMQDLDTCQAIRGDWWLSRPRWFAIPLPA